MTCRSRFTADDEQPRASLEQPGDEGVDLGERVGTPDETGLARRRARRWWRDPLRYGARRGRGDEPFGLVEDVGLQAPDLLGRIDAELVGEPGSQQPQRVERLGLPTGPVLREGEPSPEPFAERVGPRGVGQVSGGRVRLSEVEEGGGSRLDQGQAQLVQPGRLQPQRLDVLAVGIGVAPPQRERGVGHPDPFARRSGHRRFGPLGEVPRVDRLQ